MKKDMRNTPKNSRKNFPSSSQAASSRPPSRQSSHRSGARKSSPSGGVDLTRVQFPKHWRTVIGFHAIREILQVSPTAIEQVWIRQGWEDSQELKDLHRQLQSKNLKIEEKPVGLMDKVMPSHQGVAVFAGTTPQMNWSQIEQDKKSILLVLDGLEDPHNLGAILRTSWLMGVSGALTPEDRSAGLTSTVHKVACGGVEHVPVERTTNFSKPIERLKKQGYWVFGLSAEGKQDLFDLKIPDKIVWCIGSEGKGLRTTTERLCDELVRIPQLSNAASYNASVATAIALTETLRQQSRKSSPAQKSADPDMDDKID